MNVLVSIAVAVLLASAALLLARALPAQNIVLILGSLIAWEVALEAVSPGTGSPWRGWLFWPAVVVLARVGGRSILRRRRQDWNYGVWLIVLAGAVVALIQFAFALFGAPWTVAAKLAGVRFASTAFCLFWLTPWLIAKFIPPPRSLRNSPQ